MNSWCLVRCIVYAMEESWHQSSDVADSCQSCVVWPEKENLIRATKVAMFISTPLSPLRPIAITGRPWMQGIRRKEANALIQHYPALSCLIQDREGIMLSLRGNPGHWRIPPCTYNMKYICHNLVLVSKLHCYSCLSRVDPYFLGCQESYRNKNKSCTPSAVPGSKIDNCNSVPLP